MRHALGLTHQGMWSFAPRTYAFSRSEKPQSATVIDAPVLSSTFALFPGIRPLRACLGGAHAFALLGDLASSSSSGRGSNRIFRSPAGRRGSEKCGSTHALRGRVVPGCRVVQKHWLHRDKLGGGQKVRNSNLAEFREVSAPTLELVSERRANGGCQAPGNVAPTRCIASPGARLQARGQK